MVTTYCTVAMIMVFLPVALYFINQFYERFVDRPPSPSSLIVELLSGLHPVMTQLSVFYGEMAGMNGGIDIYWMYVAVYAVLSAVLLIAASHFFPPSAGRRRVPLRVPRKGTLDGA